MLHFVRNKFSLPASWNRVFVVTLVFVTLASGLFWLDFFRSYEADVTVLVVSRPGASEDGADVAENLAGLARTLSFYDRMLAGNDLIDDAFSGYASDKRKKFWNETVSVRKLDEGSVLSIEALGNTRQEATLLAQETAQTLFSVAGFYYNVKTDIDLRIIDGPISGAVVVKPLWFGIASLLTGLALTVIFFFLLNAVPGFISGPKKTDHFNVVSEQQSIPSEQFSLSEKSYPEFLPGDTVPWIDPRKFIPRKPVTLSFENVTPGVKKSAASGLRAPAPVNLPVARDETVESEVFKEESNDIFPEEQGESFDLASLDEHIASQERAEPAAVEQSEPTVEEYKRRLNKLLSGGK